MLHKVMYIMYTIMPCVCMRMKVSFLQISTATPTTSNLDEVMTNIKTKVHSPFQSSSPHYPLTFPRLAGGEYLFRIS